MSGVIVERVCGDEISKLGEEAGCDDKATDVFAQEAASDLPPLKWLIVKFHKSGWGQQAASKEIELRSTVRGPFH